MNKQTGFFFDMDSSGHYHFIPENLRTRWEELNEMLYASDEEIIYEAEESIDKEFSQYMCTRNINEYTVIEL